MSFRDYRTAAILAVSAGLYAAPLAWGQLYHDQIFGVATLYCDTQDIDKSGTGQISDFKSVTCPDSSESAEVDGIANMNPDTFSIAASGANIGAGAGTVTAIILDTVTLTPPSGYTSSRVKLEMVSKYYFQITGTVPTGSTPVSICYRAIGQSLDTCDKYGSGDTPGLVAVPVSASMTAKKNTSGIFNFEFSVTGGVSSNLNGESRLLSLPFSFYCPASGWTYTLASDAGNVVTCKVGPPS